MFGVNKELKKIRLLNRVILNNWPCETFNIILIYRVGAYFIHGEII